jgi:hypothetical protein
MKLFSVLEPDQHTVAYVLDNMEGIKKRFSNLNKDVRGGTVDEYARRVLFAAKDYVKWKADRGAWERDAGSRGNATSDGDKKAKAERDVGSYSSPGYIRRYLAMNCRKNRYESGTNYAFESSLRTSLSSESVRRRPN